MKKMHKVLLALVAAVALALGVMGAAACGGGSASVDKTYMGYNTVITEAGQAGTMVSTEVAHLKLNDDGSYELEVTVQSMSASAKMVYQTIGATVYGSSCTISDPEGGYQKVEISIDSMTRIIIEHNAMNMFVKHYDTETTEFPTTLLGDDTTMVDKEGVLNAYRGDPDYAAGEYNRYGNIVGNRTFYIVLNADDTQSTRMVYSID